MAWSPIITAVALVTTIANTAPASEAVSEAPLRHATKDKTLTEDDRSGLRRLGFDKLHAGAVVVRKIPKNVDWQIPRLRELVRSVDGFAPSGVCDRIVRDGVGTGLCTGRIDGPIGKVAVRMPIRAAMTEDASGSVLVVLTNPRALEAKGLFSWSQVVNPNGLKLAVDLVPDHDGWLMVTRIGVVMNDHESSAEDVSEALTKLDAWLAAELARTGPPEAR